MKTIKTFFFIPFMFLASNLNSQIFVGGDFNFNTSKFKQTNSNGTLQLSTGTSFSLYPFIGKFTSDKFAIGISLNSNVNTSNSLAGPSSTFYTIGISPFVRYYAINWNKFSVYGVGNIGLDYLKTSAKTTKTYINFYPGISYNLNDKLSLETGIGILNLGFSYSVGKNGSVRDHVTNFNIGGGLDNISAIQNIVIGAIYKFNK